MTNVLNSQFTNLVNYLKSEGTGSTHAFNHTNITVNINGLADHAGQYAAAQNAFALWSISTGLRFTFTTGAADITLDNTDSNAYTQMSWSGSTMIDAFINVGKTWVPNWSIGAYGVQTFIHEIGHALGLNHGGPYNGNGNYATDAIYDVDTWQYSVMSYFDQSNYNNASTLYLISPMIADIKAIKDLYGSLAVNTGNTIYGRGETNYSGWTDFGRYAQSTYSINDSSGVDTLNYSNTTYSALIDLRAGHFSNVNGYVGNVSIALGTVVENAYGSTTGDTMIGNEVGNMLRGLGGNDAIYSGGGNDVLGGGIGADYLDGSLGVDTATYSTAATGVAASLRAQTTNTGEAYGDRYVGIENIEGSGFADRLAGHSGNNILWGGAGADVLDGDAGNDTLVGGLQADTVYGGLGNDALYGGAAADYLNGGAGVDTACYGDSLAGLTVNMASPTACTGIAYGDVMVGIENLIGSNYADVLVANATSNSIWGGAGNDGLFGVGGNDVLYGGAGADRLYGGLGADRFVFSAATETTYAATGRDIIYDFSYAQGDRIDLTAVDANLRVGGNQAFSFIGTAAFTGVAGQLHVAAITGGNMLVSADLNGDRVADLSIYLYHATAASAASYLL